MCVRHVQDMSFCAPPMTRIIRHLFFQTRGYQPTVFPAAPRWRIEGSDPSVTEPGVIYDALHQV